MPDPFKLKDVGQVIATRSLYVLRAPDRKFVVEIGLPQPFPEGGSFYCPIQVIGDSEDRVVPVGGVDAVQALQLAMKVISVRLFAINRQVEGQLRWEGDENGDLGFPEFDFNLPREAPRELEISRAVEKQRQKNMGIRKSLSESDLKRKDNLILFEYFASQQERAVSLARALYGYGFILRSPHPEINSDSWKITATTIDSLETVLGDEATTFHVQVAKLYGCEYEGLTVSA
jgi:hypothetical protein